MFKPTIRALVLALSLLAASLISQPATAAPLHGTEGGMCGGIAGFQCKPGLTCRMDPRQAQMPDAAGVCVRERPRRPGRAGERCGGFAGLQCRSGLYCYIPPAGGPVSDAAGVCRARPRVCTREYRPVCGVNGRTYGNPCRAASTGVNVAHRGPCR